MNAIPQESAMPILQVRHYRAIWHPTSVLVPYQFAFLPIINNLLVGVIVPIVLNDRLIIRGCQGTN